MLERYERWLRRLDVAVWRIGWIVVFIAVVWFTGSTVLHVIS